MCCLASPYWCTGRGRSRCWRRAAMLLAVAVNNGLDDAVPGWDRVQHAPRALPEGYMSTSTIILLVVIVGAVLWVISVYNGLVAMRQRVNQAFADVDVQLRQRHDLVPNLVETVKGYAAHERGTLDDVVKARNAAVTAQGPAQQAAAENMLTGALRQLFALSEAYPDLKANANFQQLQA